MQVVFYHEPLGMNLGKEKRTHKKNQNIIAVLSESSFTNIWPFNIYKAKKIWHLEMFKNL